MVNYDKDSWNTPMDVVERVRAVFQGQIDLDPCSNEAAQIVIRARTYYTLGNDGLTHEWFGRVWLNPPFSNPAPWVDNLLGSRFASAITLTNNCTETTWCQRLMHQATAILLPHKRVRFWHAERSGAGARQGQIICYFGDRPDLFRLYFGSMGSLWVRS